MCGRYVLAPNEPFEIRYGLEKLETMLKSNYNITPGSTMPVVINNGQNEIEYMKWGLIPTWAKDKPGFQLINSRSETLITKPYFTKILETQRCLIPATGFYEWQKKDDKKLPFLFTLNNNEIFSFAGIYNDNSYSIITVDANSVVSPIHNRMPLIIRKEDESDWNSPDTELKDIFSLLNPYPLKSMSACQVSTKINSVQENSSDLLKPVE